MKINIGGGNTKIEGYKNIDILPLENVDIVCDLTKNIPLEDDSVDMVYARHSFEHIQNLPHLVEELYRVCKNGAVIEIKCPYFKSNGAFKDPTHVNFITEGTFDYFNKDLIKKGLLPNYNFKCDFRVEKMYYLWANRFIKFIPFKKILLRYFWNIAHSIYFKLVVVK